MTRTECFAILGVGVAAFVLGLYAVYLSMGFPPALSNLDLAVIGGVMLFCGIVVVLIEDT